MGPKKKQESQLSLMVARYLKSLGYDQTYASFLTESKNAVTDAQVIESDAIDIQEVYSFWKASNESTGNGTKRKAEVAEVPSVQPVRASKRSKGKAGVVDPEVVNGDVTAVTNEKGKSKKKGKETTKKSVTGDKDEVEDKSPEEQSLAVSVEAIEVVKGKSGKEKPKGKKAKEPAAEGDIIKLKEKTVNQGPLAPAVDDGVAETEKRKAVKGGRKAKEPARVKQPEEVSVEDGGGEGLEEGAEQTDAEPAEQEVKGEIMKKKRSKKVNAVVEETLTLEDAPPTKSSEEATVAPVVEARKSKRAKKKVNVEPLEVDIPAKTSEEDIAVKSSENAVSPGSAGKSTEGKGTAARAFQRVRVEEVAFLDERLKDNSYWAKKGAESGWGAKAQEVLGQVRGKGFRHEKTKKKRGSYKGGPIDMESHSIKFQNSDDDE